jgi:hypothetical protein
MGRQIAADDGKARDEEALAEKAHSTDREQPNAATVRGKYRAPGIAGGAVEKQCQRQKQRGGSTPWPQQNRRKCLLQICGEIDRR